MTSSRDLLARRPERLVTLGFRNMMAAYELGDASCWESIWQQFIAELGASGARQLVGELQYWARSLRIAAERPLSYFPQCCMQLCHDECMALSLVSAAQAADRATGHLASRYLTGKSDHRTLESLWQATLPFATALETNGGRMYPVTSDVVESIFLMQCAGKCRAVCGKLN
jgi:hypothetical protein